jgi:hypothetical protein
MIESILPPTWRMASSTVRSQLPGVRIVLPVTRNARFACTGIDIVLMTVDTFCKGVRTCKRVLCLSMVKGDQPPAFGHMAPLTPRAQMTGMGLVVRMTAQAGCGHALENVVNVAVRAGYEGVCTGERKGCPAVREFRVAKALGRGEVGSEC